MHNLPYQQPKQIPMKTQRPRKGLLIPTHIPNDRRKENITEIRNVYVLLF